MSRLNVLLVEDDQDTRANLVDILSLDGCELTCADSIAAALDCLRTDEFHVVLLDRKLPDGTADVLLPQLRKTAPDADVVICTGYADLDGTVTALRHGASDYIIKPINPDALRASLRRLAGRREMQQKLNEERQFAERILGTAEAIILLVDEHGRIVRFNSYLAELAGITVEQVKGQVWYEVLVPEHDRERVEDVFMYTIADHEARGVINPVIDVIGRERQVRWAYSTIKDDGGASTGMLLVGLDVTDVVETQKRLLQAERLAAIGQTMAGLAHESRNALQRIKANIELLELECQDHPQMMRSLKRIEDASEDLRCLLEEVRSYAAPVQLKLQHAEISRAWIRAWDSLQSEITGRDVVLVDDDADSIAALDIDVRRIEQVFRNLLQNSLDAGEDPLRITIRTRVQGNQLLIDVLDDGPGWGDRNPEEFFNAFVTTKADGTGLGLAISRRIVEAHHGSIQAVPCDCGAHFLIALPLGVL
ncbi:MAG: response regulator [Planctomycetales bacterium]|nr:response regulator [Planctomycetales bacterium]